MQNYLIIAESEEGGYEPVGEAVNSQEACEIAASDMRRRKKELEAGQAPMCPFQYNLWGRNRDGSFKPLAQIQAEEL